MSKTIAKQKLNLVSALRVLVYLFQEGRSIGLEDKIHALELMRQEGLDTVESMARLGYVPDERQYDVAIAALKDLNVCSQIHLISDNPHKRAQLEIGGFTVIERVKLGYHLTPLTQNELLAKIQWLAA